MVRQASIVSRRISVCLARLADRCSGPGACAIAKSSRDSTLRACTTQAAVPRRFGVKSPSPSGKNERAQGGVERLGLRGMLDCRQSCQETSMPIDLAHLKPGLNGSAELKVAVEHTAPRVGSGLVPVLATPVMINLIEAAALAAVEHLLPAGHQSLGIRLDVRHFAATPVGLTVVATAQVMKVEGRTISFHVEARDEREPIGDGLHERVVVNVARFDDRVQRKVRGGAP